MAYAYTERFEVWESGDKVVADSELDYDNLEVVEIGTVLTIKTVELRDDMDPGDMAYELTFKEVAGTFYDIDFHLAPGTLIREY